MIGNIYINGCIGVWEGESSVTLLDIVKQVKEQSEATAYNVYINSEGGYVEDGFDILNYLRSLGKPITTIGNGIVASIATVIFMAGNTRQVRENTQFMVHLPWQQMGGTADEIEAEVKGLRNAEKQLLDFYKKELSLTDEVVYPLLRDETYLSQEQLSTLGFTTTEPLKVAAKANFKTTNKMSEFTEKDRTWIEGLFSKVLDKFKPKTANKLVQDATGAELDFGELADDAVIEVGATATVDGKPAEGEYTLPDETVYVFEAGVLTEIRPVEEETDLDAANARIAELEEQLATETAAKVTAEEGLETVKTEVLNLRTQIRSKFKPEGKKAKPNPAGGDEDDRTAGIKSYIKKKNK